MKRMCLILCLCLLTLKVFAGFDAGGGPGISLERLMGFFKNSPKYLVEGLLLDHQDGEFLRMTTTQKSNAHGLNSMSGASVWSDVVQTDMYSNFIVLVINKREDPKEVVYVIVEFDQIDIENGNLSFDLLGHAKTFVFDTKNRQFLKIHFKDFYLDLCDEKGCPRIFFLSMMPKE